MAAKEKKRRKAESIVQNVGLVFRLRIKWIAKTCLFSVSAIPGSDQTGFTNHVNWFCVLVRLKGLPRLVYLKHFLCVFYFLNNLIPFLMGKEILCSGFSLNWIFTSTLKLPQLAELSLTKWLSGQVSISAYLASLIDSVATFFFTFSCYFYPAGSSVDSASHRS